MNQPPKNSELQIACEKYSVEEFRKFVKQLQQGQPVDQALQRVYGSGAQQVARAYATSLKR